MRKISIKLPHTTVKITIGRGLLQKAKRISLNTGLSLYKSIIVTDRKTSSWAKILAKQIRSPIIELRAGESTKSLSTVEFLYKEFLKLKLERSSSIFAVGGGTITDTVGFAAATFMRGLALVNVPTTFLGQLDASIGGKTGVNVSGAKNLIGAFYQPKVIIIDPNCLDTLPEGDFKTGLAEAVKYSMIKDPSLLKYINATNPDIDEIIYRCAKIKANVVQMDERESSSRMVLNYGHTIGHAIERASNFKFSHGKAISIGMDCELYIATLLGIATKRVYEHQHQVLCALGLPTRVPNTYQDKIKVSLFFDKKIKGGKLRFVLVRDIGKPVFPVTVPKSTVFKALNHTVE